MRLLVKVPAIKQKSESKKQLRQASKPHQKDEEEQGTRKNASMSLEKSEKQVAPDQAQSNSTCIPKRERNRNNNRKTSTLHQQLNHENEGNCKSRPVRGVSCYRQQCRTSPVLKARVCCPVVAPHRVNHRALKGALRGQVPSRESSGPHSVWEKPKTTKRQKKKGGRTGVTVLSTINPFQKSNNAKAKLQNENTNEKKEKMNLGSFVRGKKTKRKLCIAQSEDESTIKKSNSKIHKRENKASKPSRMPLNEKQTITSGLPGMARPPATGSIAPYVNSKGKSARSQAISYPSVHTLDEQRALYNLITATTPSVAGGSCQPLLANGKSGTSVIIHEEMVSTHPPQMVITGNQQDIALAKDNVLMKSFKIPLKSKVVAMSKKKTKFKEIVIQRKKKNSKVGLIRRNKKARPMTSRRIQTNIGQSPFPKTKAIASEKMLLKTWPITGEVSSECSPVHLIGYEAKADEASRDKDKEYQFSKPTATQLTSQAKNVISVCMVNSSDRPASVCGMQSYGESTRFGNQRPNPLSNTRTFENTHHLTTRPHSAFTTVDTPHDTREITCKVDREDHPQSANNWPSASQCFRNFSFSLSNSQKYSPSWSVKSNMSFKENNNFQKSQPLQMFVCRNSEDALQATHAFNSSLQRRRSSNGQYVNNTPMFSSPTQWHIPRGSQSNLDLSNHSLTQEVHRLHHRMLTELGRPGRIDLMQVDSPWQNHCMQYKDSVKESNDKTLKAIFKRLDPTASPFF